MKKNALTATAIVSLTLLGIVGFMFTDAHIPIAIFYPFAIGFLMAGIDNDDD